MKRALKYLIGLGLVALVANEIRGVVMAAPVLWLMLQSGGNAMAVWVGVCSLAGIAVSVAVPAYAARKFVFQPARQRRQSI